jgi:RNA polymerase sigma-70 factor (ECF subfamily)
LAIDPTDAGDLLQDAYERALVAPGDLGPEELCRWLVKVIRHLAIDRARQRRSRRRRLYLYSADLIPVVSDPEECSPWLALTADDVSSAVDKLGPPFREVFQLHTGDASLAQIAAALGIPPSTAGTRLHRARRKLRTLLVRALQSPAIDRRDCEA